MVKRLLLFLSLLMIPTVVITVPAPVLAQTVVVQNAFAGTAGTDLGGTTGAVGGAWTKNTAYPGTLVLDGSGGVYPPLTSGNAVYTNTATSGAGQNYHECDIQVLSVVNSDSVYLVFYDNSGSEHSYRAQITVSGTTASFNVLRRDTASSGSVISTNGATNYPLVTGDYYRLRFEVAFNGSQILKISPPSATPIGNTYPAGYTIVASATDTTYSVGGKFALESSSSSTALTATTGMHIMAELGVTSASSVTIPVNSIAFRTSPGNWTGDTGRGGSVYRQTWNINAYCDITFNSTSNYPSATLDISNQSGGTTIAYTLNGIMTDNVSVPASGGTVIHGVVPGLNVLRVTTRQSFQAGGRWVDTDAWKIIDLRVDTGGTAVAGVPYQPWGIFVVDSIGDGVNTISLSADSVIPAWTYNLGLALATHGYDYDQNGCGGSGWAKPGDSTGDVPGWYSVTGSSGGTGGTYTDNASRWNKIDTNNSILDSNGHYSAYGATGTEPSFVLTEIETNEALNSASWTTSDVQASVAASLVSMRGAAPNAWLLIGVPFEIYNTSVYTVGGSYASALKAGVASYQAAHPADLKVKVIDTTQAIANLLNSPIYYNPNSSGVHLLASGHQVIQSYITDQVMTTLFPSTTLTPRTSGQLAR